MRKQVGDEEGKRAGARGGAGVEVAGQKEAAISGMDLQMSLNSMSCDSHDIMPSTDKLLNASP